MKLVYGEKTPDEDVVHIEGGMKVARFHQEWPDANEQNRSRSGFSFETESTVFMNEVAVTALDIINENALPTLASGLCGKRLYAAVVFKIANHHDCAVEISFFTIGFED